MLYCQVVLPRAGLGHRFFPWARCRIFSFVNKVPMLFPIWLQIRVGPLLRRESDFRLYHNLFKKKPEDIGGIRRTWLPIVADKILESEDFNLQQIKETSKDTVIAFSGVGGYFQKLNGWDEFLLQEIRAMTWKRWLDEIDRIPIVPIGIHVRRGDFKVPKSGSDFYTTGALRTPIVWFVKSLNVIREILGFSAKAFVVSDGAEREIKDLLSLKDVIFFRSGCAISELLLLSKAKILIASGSSFSAWASFLGQMPTISHPGQSLAWFKLTNRKGYYLGEFVPKMPPQQFVEQIKTISSDLKK